jgi:multidrug efflux pump
VLTVAADVPEGVLPDDKVTEIKHWLNSATIDPRVTIEFKGEDEEQRQAEAFLVKAFGIALFIMAIILVTQFNSFYQSLLILSAVVLSTVGVLLGLLVTGQPFGIVMSGVGVIALAGIVVNNNIVLIDTYNILRRRGLDTIEAVIRTGAQRLRPVLLTTITTVLGLMPMVLGINIDLMDRSIAIGGPSTQWWTQLATAVAGGLAFATLLTLVLTPSLLVLGERLKFGRKSTADHGIPAATS